MPLTQLAGLYGAAIIAVTHLRKSAASEALLAVTGSLGFVAASRAAYLAVKDASDPARQLWLPVKNKLGPELPGLAYRIVPCEIANGIATSRVEWDAEPVTITADGALGAHADHDELRTERDAVDEWLRDLVDRSGACSRGTGGSEVGRPQLGNGAARQGRHPRAGEARRVRQGRGVEVESASERCSHHRCH